MIAGDRTCPGPATAARFRDALTELPLDVGTIPDQRAVMDALDALAEAATRALGGAP